MAKIPSFGKGPSNLRPKKTPLPKVKSRVKRGYVQKSNAMNLKRLSKGQRGR
jgi:hypothetical protein